VWLRTSYLWQSSVLDLDLTLFRAWFGVIVYGGRGTVMRTDMERLILGGLILGTVLGYFGVILFCFGIM